MTAELAQAVQRFKEAFLVFEIDSMQGHAQKLLDAGATGQDFLTACIPCMEEIGKKFEAGDYYLPHLVVAGEMFKTVKQEIHSKLPDESTGHSAGQIVLGTPAGDIHDLGKDIFAVLAAASGFTVHNLVVDVKPELFINKIKETKATVLGLSSLLTTTFEAIQQIIAQLNQEDLRQQTFVIIGGGATDAGLISKLGVDAQTRDAYEGIRLIRNHLRSEQKGVAA